MNFDSNGSSGEVELNLAPILDCLTVLVAFLLASASFLSLSVLDAGLAAQSAAAPQTQENQTLIKVRIQADGSFSLSWQNETARSIKDLPELVKQLQARNTQNPVALLSADPNVPVQNLINTLDSIRTLTPPLPVSLAEI